MNKKTVIAITIAVILVGVLIGGGLISGLFTNSSNSNNASMQNTTNMQQQAGQIQTQDTVVGTGDVATAGKEVTVNYTGYLNDTNHTVFDSSVGRAPFSFALGAGQVIKGWDIGVEGMKVGGKRILIIPPELGYGSTPVTDPQTGKVIIPASSTLIFEVELLGVK